MEGRNSKVPISLIHLQCPVCKDIYNDPRFLPCAHTFCSACTNQLIAEEGGQRIICPLCRDENDACTTANGAFKPNLALVGMLDSLCKQCKYVRAEIRCPHCTLMVCQACHQNHATYTEAKQCATDLNASIGAGEKVLVDDLIKRLITIEKEIDTTIDGLIKELQDRRQVLKVELRGVIAKSIDSRKTWKDELITNLSAASSLLETMTNQLGESYDDQITAEGMKDMKSQSEEKIKELQLVISNAPVVPAPCLKYNSFGVFSKIQSFGRIEMLKATSDLVVMDIHPCDEPMVVGGEGTGPGE